MIKKNIFYRVLLSIFIGFYNIFFYSLSSKAEIKELSEYNQSQVCIQGLESAINSILNQSERSRENWGILIEKLNQNQTLYKLNENKYFIPASNVKLFTTASFLLNFGENFTIKTPIYIKGKEEFIDELIIIGKGDPTITKSDLEDIAKKLQQLNINHVKNLILVNSSPIKYPFNNSWEFSDLYFYYAVPINSFILEENTVTLSLIPSQVGKPILLKWSDKLAGRQWLITNEGVTVSEGEEYSINLNPMGLESRLRIEGNLPVNNDDDNWRLSIPNPEQYFQDSLIAILQNNGIQVEKTEIIGQKNIDLSDANLLLEINSPNSKNLIAEINQNSNNLYAEILLSYLATNQDTKFISQTKILENVGLLSNDYSLKDASGLSRQNLVTPKSLVTLLKLMDKTEYAKIFRNSLSLAGVNGTLKNRFQNEDIIDNNLWGKTGTLTGVSALSGYLRTKGDDVVFSIMVNNSSALSKELRDTIDKLLVIVAQSQHCANNS